jgi:hypothetical protein
MSLRALILTTAVTLIAVPAAAQTSPEAMVRAIYTPEAPPDDVSKLMARDLAGAYAKDGSSSDEVGAIDFDWRYGTQETEIKNLTFSTSSDAIGPVVTAKFINEGSPGTVNYHFCKAAGGWRIADVNSPDQDGWGLRAMLKLDTKRVDC